MLMQEERHCFSPSSMIDGCMPVVNMCRNSVAHRTQYDLYPRHKFVPFYEMPSILDDLSTEYGGEFFKMSNTTIGNVPYIRMQLPTQPSMHATKTLAQIQNRNDAAGSLQTDAVNALASLPVKRTLDGTVKSNNDAELQRAEKSQDDLSNRKYLLIAMAFFVGIFIVKLVRISSAN